MVNLLKISFLPSDYDDKLWEEIKQRRQGREEPVAIFIAVMETLFSRLTKPPAEVTRVKHITRNLLPHYVKHLALSEIKTVAELGTLCKKLEEACTFTNKFQPCSKPLLNVIEPELAYIQNPSTSTSHSVSDNVQLKSRKHNLQRKFVTREKQNVTCWNCNQPNHTYSHCTQKRTIFCYRCGKPNTTVAKCNHSGNE